MILRKQKELKIIGVGLVVLYATALLFYILAMMRGEAGPHGISMAVFLVVLLVGSFAVIKLREWGRIVLVVGNAAMGVFLVTPYLAAADIIPISFIFMNVALLMFFNQNKIRRYFTSGKFLNKAKDWQCILLVDDDETLIRSVRPFLISNGYSVLTAITGEDGIQVAKTQQPDLIILDVILPGLKGRDVCGMLKEDEDTKEIPIIFLTAKDSKDDVDAELAVGAVAHLTKPVDIKVLITTIQDILGKKE